MSRRLLTLLLALWSGPLAAATAVVRDGSVGPDASVQPLLDGGVVEIDESLGSRPGGGVNLFHSFSEFSVAAGDTALFTADSALLTERVIGRVTGTDPSRIDGTLASAIPGADLFLLNPRGILFGADARLDVQGSFFAATASSLSMLDGDPQGLLTFSNDARLAFATPRAFGFLGAPATVSVAGATLAVPADELLLLAGADVTLDSGSAVTASGGVQLAAVGAAATAPVDLHGWEGADGGTLSLRDALIAAEGGGSGDIQLAGGTVALVDAGISTGTSGGRPAGNIGIRAAELLRIEGGTIASSTLAAGRAGSILMAAPIVEIVDGTLVVSASGPPEAGGGGGGDGGGGGSGGGGSGGGGSGGGSGDGGSGGGESGGGSGGGGSGGGGSGGGGSGGGSGGGGSGGGGSATGAGGDVTVVAGERITIRQEVNVAAVSNAGGDAGVLSLTAPVVEILNGSRIASAAAAAGNAGSVRIRGSERVELSGGSAPGDVDRDRGSRITASSAFTATGDAGDISIEGGEIILDHGARVSSGTSGLGQGGSVVVRASDRLILRGAREDGEGTSIRAASEVEESEAPGDLADRTGNAGSILVSTPHLVLEPGTEIRSTTALPGVGGLIELDVARLDMTDALIKAGSVGSGAGDAGNILLGVHQDGSATQHALGDVVLTDSSIETSADDAGGGDIVLRGSGSLRLTRSAVDASDTASDGGNVDVVATDDILVLEQSRILARAAIPGGAGGVIRITTDAFIRSPDSLVVAENEVIINSPETNVEADLVELPGEFADAGRLFEPLCAARSGADDAGRFTVEPTPGLPVSPAEIQLAWTSALPRGDWPEVADSLRAARDRGADEAARRRASLALAEVLTLQGDFAGAVSEADGLAAEPASGNVIAVAATARGDLAGAEQAFARALAAPGAEDADLRAALLINLGNLETLRGRTDAARGHYAEARRIAAAAGGVLRQRQAVAADWAAHPGMPDAAALRLLGAPLPLDQQSVWNRLFVAHRLIDRAAANADADGALRALALTELTAARDGATALGNDRLLAHAYAGLGRLYEIDGRFDDALTLTRVALQLATGSAEDARYPWYGQAGRLLKALGIETEAIAAFRSAVAELERHRPVTRQRYGSGEVDFRGVYVDLVSSLLDAAGDAAAAPRREQGRREQGRREEARGEQGRLVEARLVVERFKQTELRNYFHDECVAALEASATVLDDVDPQTGVVYPLLLPDRVELLVSHGGSIRRYRHPAAGAEVMAQARALRLLLEDRTTNEYLPLAQALYGVLVAPYRADLAAAGVHTLVFVPDGPLHGIPFGALHDGDAFLVQSFAVAVTPGLTLTAPRPLEARQAEVLLAGVSGPRPGFDQLPNVAGELAGIRALIGGELLLDDAFRSDAFKDQVVNRQPDIVHVASHASFGGSSGTSFLVTHDGVLSIDELHRLVAESRFREPLELLTLSACETAAGDEQAALGLSGTAIRAGARSALGTLWTVSDVASEELVVEFYRQLAAPGTSKASALQQAQRRMIDSDRFWHPYYWSPYLLISNWL